MDYITFSLDDLFIDVLKFNNYISEAENAVAIRKIDIHEIFEPNFKYLPQIEKGFAYIQKLILAKKLDKQKIKQFFEVIDKFYYGKLKEFNIIDRRQFKNAYIFCNYKNIFFSKNLFKPPTFDDITGIYIGFGTPLIKMLTPRECVAVLLHETGHVLQYSVRFTVWMTVLKRIVEVSTNSIITLLKIISGEPLLALSLFVFGRTLYFLDHLKEFNADVYAAKHGYGEEIMSVLYKMDRYAKKPKTKVSKIKQYLKWILNIIIQFDPSHPPMERRICNVLSQLNKEYNNQYKIKSPQVKRILSKIEC